MPHISIKMLEGRTDEQKKIAAQKVADALVEAVGCSYDHVSVSVEDYSKVEWQGVFKDEVKKKSEYLFKEPNYDPADMLK